MKRVNARLLMCVSLLLSGTDAWAYAVIDKAQASRLGTEFTPVGADPKANAEGTVPAWSGSVIGVPAGLDYSGSGSVYPDPYANEKPLFVISNTNLAQYKDKLTAGMLALFAKYDNYTMPVYPAHRDFRYHPQIEARTRWNVGNAELVNGIDGLQKMTGGVPFPIPQDGVEVMWNARVNHPVPVADSLTDDVAVYADGARQSTRTRVIAESPYAYEEHPIGRVAEDIGIYAALIYMEAVEPARKKGEMAIVLEPLDQEKNKRKAWVYLPGVKRVKSVPNAGFDTPIGPGGLMTADDIGGFNGSMSRFDWKLVGKQEVYIPYHNYRFDEAGVKLDVLLPPRYVNPDYMRYELHRVWVVEATLKAGQRHAYSKRRFYMDEDTWLIVATESYDAHGELWRVVLQNTLYDFYLKGFIVRASVHYDLLAAAYNASGLVNQTRPTDFAMKVRGEKFYSPLNLKALAGKGGVK